MCNVLGSTAKRRSSLALSVMLEVLAISFVACAQAAEPTPAVAPIERGQYLAKIGGCNDCHTEGYAEQAGNMPAKSQAVHARPHGRAMGSQGQRLTSTAADALV
jgi:hypothetical protein